MELDLNKIIKESKKLRADILVITVCLGILAIILFMNIIFIVSGLIIILIIEIVLIVFFIVLILVLLVGLNRNPIISEEDKDTYKKYIKMGENYAQLNDFSKSKKYIDLGLELAKLNSDSKWIERGNKLLVKIKNELN